MWVKVPESLGKLGKQQNKPAVIAVSAEDVKSQYTYGEDLAGSYGTSVINTFHCGSQCLS